MLLHHTITVTRELYGFSNYFSATLKIKKNLCCNAAVRLMPCTFISSCRGHERSKVSQVLQNIIPCVIQLYSLILSGVTVLINIILTQSCLSVAHASSAFKCLGMHKMPMHATPIFTTEAFHLVSCIQQFYRTVKLKVIRYTVRR